jgi:hypothetical protein
MIVSKGLYDSAGISYVDNSFDKFDPDYLFENGRVFRWQRADRGKGRHLGKGYSDHLPVFAEFSTHPFCLASQKNPIVPEVAEANIAGLYRLERGSVNIRIHDSVVIYKESDNAVIKQKNGRAIYIYKAAKELQYSMVYDLTVKQLNRHFGNMEITGINDVELIGRETDMDACFIDGPPPDFAAPDVRNEIVKMVNGIYENGWLHYGDNQKIKLYFANQVQAPGNFTAVTVSHARIGYHNHPEIIVEKPDQIR